MQAVAIVSDMLVFLCRAFEPGKQRRPLPDEAKIALQRIRRAAGRRPVWRCDG
jgi:hypothetical protein